MIILSNDSRFRQRGFGALALFFRPGAIFFALLVLSVGLFASLERFVLDLGPSGLDVAPPDSPWDALDVVFGGPSGLICKISDACTGFVASIDFSSNFRMFSQWLLDRLSAQLLITSSIAFALDRRRSGWLKPRKTQAGAIKIKVLRQLGFWRASTTPSEKAIETLSENDRQNDQKSTRERSKTTLEFRHGNLQKLIRERLGRRSPRQMGSKCCPGALQLRF